MNWRAKIAIQSALARIPGGQHANYGLQWLNGSYSKERMHSRLIEQTTKLKKVLSSIDVGGATVVEVGTGWELVAPILFYLFGAHRTYTYDHLHHLRFDIPRILISMLDADELSSISGINASDLQGRISKLKTCRTLDDLLGLANIAYRAPSDACHTGLPANSVDLFFTHEVLEHVPEAVLDGLVAESKRVLKPSGVAYHAIEPGDHYTRETSHINHFRYPEWLWSTLNKNHISYHNRLCSRHFLEAFARHGARIMALESRMSERDLADLQNGFKLDKRFKHLPVEELAVWYLEVLYQFR
jgi:hypothetical protein